MNAYFYVSESPYKKPSDCTTCLSTFKLRSDTPHQALLNYPYNIYMARPAYQFENKTVLLFCAYVMTFYTINRCRVNQLNQRLHITI